MSFLQKLGGLFKKKKKAPVTPEVPPATEEPEEPVFGNRIPILTDEEYNDKDNEVWKKREAGDAVARLRFMYHVATHMKNESSMIVLGVEAMLLGDKDEISQYIDYDIATAALYEIMEVAQAGLAKVKENEEEEKRQEFEAEPHLTADGKDPNAVVVRTNGQAELVHLNGFVDGEDLGAPIDCDRVDMVLRNLPEWSEETFDLQLAGCVDKNGMPKGLEENDRIQSLSGYDYIAGDCVLVGIDKKYAYLPLHPQDAVRVWKYFNG